MSGNASAKRYWFAALDKTRLGERSGEDVARGLLSVDKRKDSEPERRHQEHRPVGHRQHKKHVSLIDLAVPVAVLRADHGQEEAEQRAEQDGEHSERHQRDVSIDAWEDVWKRGAPADVAAVALKIGSAVCAARREDAHRLPAVRANTGPPRLESHGARIISRPGWERRCSVK